MLYQIYETQQSMMEPFADFAQAASKLYGNPLSHRARPVRPARRRQLRPVPTVEGLREAEFGINTVDLDGVIAIHERIELDKPFCELRRFKRFTDDTATSRA